MRFTSFLEDGRLTVALTGEIDHHRAKHYIHAISAKIEAYTPAQCVLDFTEVTFVDSSGIAVVIIRKDLIGECLPNTPDILSYALMAKHDSMLNTPATYPIYVLGKVLKWIQDCGGIDEIEKSNIAKAKLLYDYLDSQDYYTAPVEKASRSMMNVTFVTGDADLDKKFASEASAAGLKNLKGHRSVGGMRASIYNAMPYEGVEKLVAFMKEFAEKNPK